MKLPHKIPFRSVVFIISFFFFVSFVNNSSAKNTSEAEIISEFLQQGAANYQANDLEGAVNNFARVLLLDPANKSARQNLGEISKEFDLPAVQKAQLFLLEDLLSLIDNLRLKVRYFKNKRDSLAMVLGNSTYASMFEQKFQEINSNFSLPKDKDLKIQSDSKNSLNMLNKSLLLEKESLSKELSSIQAQFAWLRGNFEGESLTIETPPIHVTVKDSMPEIPQVILNSSMDPDSSGSLQQIAKVREELEEFRQQIKALQDEVATKDERIAALTRQVVEFSLKLTEREIVLNEKIDMINSLHEAYADLQSRQELGQKILEDKNSQIQSLQDSFAALESDTARHTQEIKALTAASRTAVEEWQNILRIYQAKLKDATRRIDTSRHDIIALNEQLTLARTRLFEKETALEKTKQKLASLEEKFQSAISGDNR